MILVLFLAASVVFAIAVGVGAVLANVEEPLPYEQACECWRRIDQK